MTSGPRTTDGHRTKILILGAGYAGLLAALRIAGRTRKTNTQVTLVNNRDTFTERIRLHQLAANQSLPTLSIPQLLRGTGVVFERGWVQRIDPEAQRVAVRQDDGETILTYDRLIYALGSTVDRESIPGVAENTLALSNPAMIEGLREQLQKQAQKQGRLLVVGGGLTGIEAATEMAETYPRLQVTLVTHGKLGENLSVKGRLYLENQFAKLGICVKEGVKVVSVAEDYLLDKAGQKHPFDLCLWAAGFRVPQLAAEARIATDSKGRICVDEHLISISHPNIHVIGDSAATPLRMACATAMPMGGYASDTIVNQIEGGAPLQPFRFAYMLQCISLGRGKALVQMVDALDRPQDRIITGRIGACVKEIICRYTVWSFWIEKWFPGTYRWPKAQIQASPASTKLASVNFHEQSKKRFEYTG